MLKLKGEARSCPITKMTEIGQKFEKPGTISGRWVNQTAYHLHGEKNAQVRIDRSLIIAYKHE